MATPIINSQIDAINSTLGELADDLVTLRPLVKDVKDSVAESYITDTATGAVASFPDGADGIPVKDLKVAIEPVQNLNGQANPWPGGGSVNKLPNSLAESKTSNGVTVTSDGKGKYTISGTASAQTTISFDLVSSYVIPTAKDQGGSGVMYLNNSVSAANNLGVVLYSNTTTIDSWSATSANRVVTNWAGMAGKTINKIGIQIPSGWSSGGTFAPMFVENGSTTETFVPYSNICPISGWNGAEVTRTGKNLWSLASSGSATNAFIFATQNISKIFKGNIALSFDGTIGTAVQFTFRRADSTGILSKIINASDLVNGHYSGTLNLSEDAVKVSVYSNGTSSLNNIQVEAGSTATSYEPYNGTTHLTDWGINQWDEEWEVGAYNTSTGAKITGNNVRSKNYIPVMPNTDYREVDLSATTARAVVMCFYDANKNFIEAKTNTTNNTFKSSANAYFMTFYCGAAYGTTYNHDISINFPASYTDYRPYADPFVGTVYKGNLDVKSGVLTVTHGMLDLGAVTWTYVSSDAVFYTAISDKKGGNVNLICSAYKSGGNTGYSTPDYTVGYSTNSSLLKRIFISDPNYTTAASFKTAMNGVQLVYELATPQTYNLTPTQVDTLLGQNNIWADCGSVDVEYRADAKLYINKMIANALNA